MDGGVFLVNKIECVLIAEQTSIPQLFSEESTGGSNPFLDEEVMDYYDQLFFIDYHKNYLQRVVVILGYSCGTPFCDSEWVRFILRVPMHLRIHKYIYKKILL